MAFINIGFGNIINSEKVIAMITYDSAPAKRLVSTAREGGHVIDATQGRKTRCILACEDDKIVLSALLPETIASRFKDQTDERGEND